MYQNVKNIDVRTTKFQQNIVTYHYFGLVWILRGHRLWTKKSDVKGTAWHMLDSTMIFDQRNFPITHATIILFSKITKYIPNKVF